MPNGEQPNVGAHIRAIREARGLSLRALAKESGLSLNAISLIERGENSPTVASLHQISGALGASIGDLFRDEDEQSTIHVTPDARATYRRHGMVMESLGAGLRDQRLQPFLITVEPDMAVERPVVHPGQELVYCLDGSIEYHVSGVTYVLGPGHSLLLDSTQPHCFCNPTNMRARLLVVFQANDALNLGRERHLDGNALE